MISPRIFIPIFTLMLTMALAQEAEKVIPEVAPLEEKYEVAIRKDIMPQQEAAVLDLKAKHAARVTAQMESARKSGKLDVVVALKEEADLLSRGEPVALTDQPETPESVKKLRAIYLSELVKINQDKNKKLKPHRDQLAKSLSPLVDDLTREGRVGEALRVKQRIERIEAASGSGPARICGRWDISHCGGTEAIWTFNKDMTYNYWNETGKYVYRGGKYLLTHTWDWEIRMVDEDTFVGICTRGRENCEIEGRRIE